MRNFMALGTANYSSLTPESGGEVADLLASPRSPGVALYNRLRLLDR